MQATVVFIVGLGDTAAALRRLAGDVEEVVKRLERAGRDRADHAAGRVAVQRGRAAAARGVPRGRPSRCRSTPPSGASRASRSPATRPGVPALLPGERISAETVAYLRELAASGARLHGASDPAFETINVLRGGAMIDPLERWAPVRREARLRRPADVRRRALHRGPGGARGLRRRHRRRADGRPRVRPPRRAPGAAGDPRRELARRARTSRPRWTRSPSCAWSTSATRRSSRPTRCARTPRSRRPSARCSRRA